MRVPLGRARISVAAVACLGIGLSAVGGSVSPATASTIPGPVQSSLSALLSSPLASIGRAAVPLPGTRVLGSLPPSRVLQLGIALAPRDPHALEEYATAVSTPGSQSFGHFITPAQFRTTFGPTAATISAIQAVLRSEGFTVSAPSTNGLILPVRATVAVAQRALHVTMQSYRLPDGTMGWSATTAPKLQAPIAGDITAVLGLDELVGPRSMLERPRTTGSAATDTSSRTAGTGSTSVRPRPKSANGGPLACAGAQMGAADGEGWTFNQLAKAYGVEGLYNSGALGQGETVAIFELEPFATSDIRVFDTCYFGAPAAATMAKRLHVVRVDGGIPAGPGSGEATLDVEDVSALAPKASIQVYEAPSANIGAEYATNDIYNAMVNADTANVISTSWGLCETALQIASPGAQEVENTIFEEAAAQGQSIFAAAGDSGSNDCADSSAPTTPTVAVDDPASQPFVVGVGGTSLSADSTPPAETVWNDGGEGGGGGGGISNSWPSPGWQADSGMAGVFNTFSQSSAYAFCTTGGSGQPAVSAPPCREVPDVSMDADEDRGTSFYQATGGDWSTIGGTSTAAPMWAAVMTDIASSNSCADLAVNSRNSERDLGFVSPALYEASATEPAKVPNFNDITQGSNDIFGLGKGYPATKGYDLASGLGSPVVTSTLAGATKATLGTDTALSASICNLVTPSVTAPSISGLTPAHGSVGGGNSIVVAGRGFSGSGVTVEAVSFGPTRASSFTVNSNGTISVIVPPQAPKAGTGGETRGTPSPVEVTVTLDTASGVTNSPPFGSASRYIYTAGSTASPLPSVSGVGASGGPVAGGNVVDVYGSGFGAPTPPVTAVTFGGVNVTKWTVLDNSELRVTVPRQTTSTRCTTGAGFHPLNTCQVQVVVVNRDGKSPTAKILAPYVGSLVANDEGIVVPTAGTEIDPAPSEYDYAPRPRIVSVSPQPYSESTAVPITVVGTGFNVLTLDWINVGVGSSNLDNFSSFNTLSDSRVTFFAILPTPVLGVKSLPGGISALGLGGLSKAIAFKYQS